MAVMIAITSQENFSPPNVIRIGAIGSGARLRRVLEQLLAQDNAITITAVYDPDASSVDQIHKDIAPQAATCSSAQEVCHRDDVDWVFIGSWNCFHAEQVCEAFACGKNVFCEKPLALSLQEARAMHEAQLASGKTFALGLVLRYSPFYRKAKELLEQGAIGHLISFEFNETLDFNHGGYIHGNWRRRREYAGTHLLEKCCHDLDLALWLTDSRPVSVASFGGINFFQAKNAALAEEIGVSPTSGRPAYRGWIDPHGVDPFTSEKDIVDNQVAILEFENGLRGTFHTNCNAGIPERRFYLLGSKGTMRLDAMTGSIELHRIGWDEPTLVYPVIQGGSHAGGDSLMARELADALRGKYAPKAGFAEGVRSLVLADAMDTAMDEHRIVELARTWDELEAEFGSLFSPKSSPQVAQPA